MAKKNPKPAGKIATARGVVLVPKKLFNQLNKVFKTMGAIEKGLATI